MAFQPSKSKKHRSVAKGDLNMNSMMDMMTIILLFLLKSYSTGGALATPSETLTLPTSVRTEKPKKELNVSVSREVLLVNEVPILNTTDIPKDEYMIPVLQQKLVEYADREKALELDVGKEFTHEVLIQGDKGINFETLFKVMYTCSKSEFYKMRLLTIQGTSRTP